MMNRHKLVIVNMYRAKNKIAFFAIHQAITKFSEFDIEFHIIWDDLDYNDEWTSKIDSLDCKIVSYTKEFFEKYCVDLKVPNDIVIKFKNFKLIYGIILSHYLKKNNLADYCLKYDDDIILGDNLDELIYCLSNKVPILVTEPMNAGCDKVLVNELLSIYDGGFERYKTLNPNYMGFNAGFIGYDLDILSDFLDPLNFTYLISLFNLNGIYNNNGEEIWGPERTKIDLQEQSFLSIMNQIRSKTAPHILNPNEYFTCPNWGVHPIYGEIDSNSENEGWDINMKSKIIHFIGHAVIKGVYVGKSKIYYKLVDEYLKQHNLI